MPTRDRIFLLAALTMEPATEKSESPKYGASVAAKASARPELENTQDPKRTRTRMQRQLIIEAHFAVANPCCNATLKIGVAFGLGDATALQNKQKNSAKPQGENPKAAHRSSCEL